MQWHVAIVLDPEVKAAARAAADLVHRPDGVWIGELVEKEIKRLERAAKKAGAK